MRQGTQRGRSWKRQAVAPPHPVARLAVMVLALVQIVAPTWHVCALGGGGSTSTCRHSQTEPAQIQALRRSAPSSKSPTEGEPHCSKCKPPLPAGAFKSLESAKPKTQAASRTSQGVSSSSGEDCCFHGTCLARLLLGMAWQAASLFRLCLIETRRVVLPIRALAAPCSPALPRLSSRGPPPISA